MMEYPGREVFPSSPLEYVACQLKFPRTPRLERDDVLSELHDRLEEVLSVPQEEVVNSATIGPGGVDRLPSENRYRFLDKSRMQSALVGRAEITVETTDYEEYGLFRELLGMVFSAVADLAPIVGIERIGLRYIDEIRVPEGIESAADWDGWVESSVLSFLQVGKDFEVLDFQNVLHLEGDIGGITLRHASLAGTGVVGEGQLRKRSKQADGPFFVIDIDSYWTPEDEVMLPFDVSSIIDVVDRLHQPVGTLFHRSITDRLREEFRRAR